MGGLIRSLRPVDLLPVVFILSIVAASLAVDRPLFFDVQSMGAWAIFTLIWVLIVVLPSVVQFDRTFWLPQYRNLPGHVVLIVLSVVVIFSTSWRSLLDPLTLIIVSSLYVLMRGFSKKKRHFSASDFIYKFSPIIISFYIYENLRWFVSNLNPNVMDQVLADWDLQLFGVHLSLWMEQYQNPVLSEWFSFHYGAYVLYPLLPALLFYYHDQKLEFEDFSLGFCICMYLGFVGYLLVPAVGPISGLIDQYHTPTISGITLSEFRTTVVEKYRYIRDAFPSLHTAISLFCVAMIRRKYPRLFLIAVFFELNLLISTIYLRMHYTVDLIAGVFVAVIAYYLAPILNRRAGVPRETDAASYSEQK